MRFVEPTESEFVFSSVLSSRVSQHLCFSRFCRACAVEIWDFRSFQFKMKRRIYYVIYIYIDGGPDRSGFRLVKYIDGNPDRSGFRLVKY